MQPNEIYYDNEPNIGVNAYFLFGHLFFKDMNALHCFIAERYGNDFVLIEITDENYQECVFKGVFTGVC